MEALVEPVRDRLVEGTFLLDRAPFVERDTDRTYQSAATPIISGDRLSTSFGCRKATAALAQPLIRHHL
jgi:hypothetical protein